MGRDHGALYTFSPLYFGPKKNLLAERNHAYLTVILAGLSGHEGFKPAGTEIQQD
jgi:hypothetical protein